MNVRQIAQEAGVSPATVSRFLNGSKVSAEKAEKISRVINHLTAVELPKTRGMKAVIGIILPDMRLRFYADIMREIIEQIPAYDFQAIFIPETGNERHSYLDIIKSRDLSGLILLNEDIKPELMKVIEAYDLKAVVCGGANLDHSERISAVHINDLAAGYEGAKYLIRLGHKKIAFLSDYPHTISSGFQRITGARKALDEAGLPFYENLWKCGEMTEANGAAFTREILKECNDFAAIFAFSDQMAVGAMNALREVGIKVPQAVSVMGFDDLPLAQNTYPGLTTIHQPISKFVSTTLDFFAETAEQKKENVEISLPFFIKERASCRSVTNTYLRNQEKENQG